MTDYLKTSMDALNRISPDEFKQSKKLPIVVVLDNIRSQSNTGSFFRTCDAFRISHLYLCGITAVPPHREIQKTALGATETVDWQYFDQTQECINQLKDQGYTLLAIEQTLNSQSLGEYNFRETEKLAVVFGNELDGVDQHIVDQCHQVIEIPQAGTKHSLNVSIAGGIVLWEIFRQRAYQLEPNTP